MFALSVGAAAVDGGLVFFPLISEDARRNRERYERLMTRLPFLPSPASWVVTELYSYSLIFLVDKDKGGAICHRHPQL